MGRSTRWAVGAAAMVVPVLTVTSPAAAAAASDSATASVSFTRTGGGSVSCTIDSQHDVDSTSGQLAVGLALHGGDLCQGTLGIAVRYVDDTGRARLVNTSARQSARADLFLHDAGTTAVTADYAVTFDGCQSSCDQELQTKTK